MRVMGLDVGSKTVGVAISDPLGFTAQGVEIIKIDEEAEEFGFDRLVTLLQLVDGANGTFFLKRIVFVGIEYHHIAET